MELTSNTSADVADAPTAPLPEWVVFACGEQLFGVPLLLTREVVTPQPLTRLPGCGAEVAGLMGLRGRVITVFDIGLLLGCPSALRGGIDYRILVLDHDERVAGLAVDRIEEIVREDAAVLSSTGVMPAGIVGAAFAGVGRVGERQFFALDPTRILSRLLT